MTSLRLIISVVALIRVQSNRQNDNIIWKDREIDSMSNSWNDHKENFV